MATVQAKPEDPRSVKTAAPEQKLDRIDEKLMPPGKYEITPETTFTIKIYLKSQDGRWILMAGPGKGIDNHEVVFRMWTYDEMVDLKKLATNYDQQKRIHMIDQDVLRRLKIQKLMASWSFGRDNPRLKIQHVQGVLTDESWTVVKRLQPNILTYIMDEMDKVYEFNG